jgi:hypothetical protein
MPEVTVAERLKEARFQTAARLRENVAQDRMATLVADALGRVLHPTQWRRYESGEREPPLDVITAVARVSGLSEAYIAFGAAPPALKIIRNDAPPPSSIDHSPTTSADVDPREKKKQSRAKPTKKKASGNR